jgi:hypothetical protein
MINVIIKKYLCKMQVYEVVKIMKENKKPLIFSKIIIRGIYG